jgi:thiamine biosynthesis lipoprotein ApbE
MSLRPIPVTGRSWRAVAPLALLLLFVFGFAVPDSRAAEPELFRFHHEGVLGTSFDMQVRAPDSAQAGLAESTALAEIERLRKILSTYDPASEISRFNTSTGPVKCSPELLEVLGLYDFWNGKSAGAYNGHLGDLIAAWKTAEKTGVPPDAATLQRIVQALGQLGWKLDRAAGTATRLPGGALTLDSLGKGYILSRAAAAVHAKVPAAQGFLLNIGGDIFASGLVDRGLRWTVGVADPKRSADNAPPLTQVRVTDRGVSTSAAYERGFTVGGRRFSHILDPRTGLPAEGVASATVIAANNANANALATILCVLKPDEGLALARQIPEVECLIVAADGRQLRTPRFAALEVPSATTTAAPATAPAVATPAKPGLWPAGYEVALALSLRVPPSGGGGRGPKRPYVAVWVEDAAGKRVRTVAVWGNKRKYLPDLSAWWKVAKEDEPWAQSVTRATRAAGQHRIAWDGFDDHGQPLPPGTYTIFLEVNREHGSHATQSGKIVCEKLPAKGTIPAGSEFDAAELTYGPAGK